jgi:hypothetical protein
MCDKSENLLLDWSNFKALELDFEFLNGDDNILFRTLKKTIGNTYYKAFN